MEREEKARLSMIEEATKAFICKIQEYEDKRTTNFQNVLLAFCFMKIEIMSELKSILSSEELSDSQKQECVKEYDTFMAKVSENKSILD